MAVNQEQKPCNENMSSVTHNNKQTITAYINTSHVIYGFNTSARPVCEGDFSAGLQVNAGEETGDAEVLH